MTKNSFRIRRIFASLGQMLLGALVTLLVVQGVLSAKADPSAASVQSVPTTISYQGVVNVSGAPYTGQGYFKFAIVDAAGAASYWSNNGTSVSGSAPTASVTLTVKQGLFTVQLGDTHLAGMTQPITPAVFNGSGQRFLRVWFSSNGTTFTLLTPDQTIASVPYALVAGQAQNGVPSGAVVIGNRNDAQLLAAGYTPITTAGTKVFPDVWTLLARSGDHAASDGFSAMWTGTEMIVWGGKNGAVYYATGARYNPQTNTWAPMAASPLAGRAGHTAIWTGSKMIVWGGQTSATTFANDGAIYDPQANHWTMLPATTLSARFNHSAVWTGSDMIIWGGEDYGTTPPGICSVDCAKKDGAAYNLAGNKWTTLPTATIDARFRHVALWTGDSGPAAHEMLILGGMGDMGNFVTQDGIYKADTKTWSTLTKTVFDTAVWDGTEVIAFRGVGGVWAINPATSAKRDIFDSPVTDGSYCTSVWSGIEMIIWCTRTATDQSWVVRYDPLLDTWTTAAPPQPNVFSPQGPSAVWTGQQMLLWGGDIPDTQHGGLMPYDQGAGYRPNYMILYRAP